MIDARTQTRLDKKDDKEKERPDAGGLVAQQLFESRTVLIFGEISQKIAKEVVAQLLALDATNADPIRLIICSQGGHVEAGDTIHDMIGFIKAPVKMIGTGWVASAGAHIFLGAEKENRFCLPNTRFLLHQPMGGVGGKTSGGGHPVTRRTAKNQHTLLYMDGKSRFIRRIPFLPGISRIMIPAVSFSR